MGFHVGADLAGVLAAALDEGTRPVLEGGGGRLGFCVAQKQKTPHKQFQWFWRVAAGCKGLTGETGSNLWQLSTPRRRGGRHPRAGSRHKDLFL